MSRSTRMLMAVHVVANALLLWLGYYWLGIGESRTSSLLWSATAALVLLCTSATLHGATFAWFEGKQPDLRAAFRTAARHLPAVLAGVVAIALAYWLLSRWADYSTQPAFNVSSWMTLKFRKPVKPNSVFRIFQTVTWVVKWVVLPVMLLPWLAAIASHGFAGFRQRLVKTRRYWILAPVLLLCSLWLPFVLLGWVPKMGSFAMEMASFVVRLLAAYLLFIGAWLLLAFLSSGGSPAFSHPRTTAKP